MLEARVCVYVLQCHSREYRARKHKTPLLRPPFHSGLNLIYQYIGFIADLLNVKFGIPSFAILSQLSGALLLELLPMAK